MNLRRIVPCLLIDRKRLVKTVRFKDPVYVGDPLNALKIFNEKQADEIIVLDIGASRDKQPPDFDFIAEMASECFMPLCYGGGVRSTEDVVRLCRLGIEKVSINEAAIHRIAVITEAAQEVGSQSIVGAVDVKSKFLGGATVRYRNGTMNAKRDPLDYITNLVNAGAGEIFINSVDRDGTFTGYDVQLIGRIAERVQVPVIACGGAGSISHIQQLFRMTKVQAAAAGSLFVLQKEHRAVLITYPEPSVAESIRILE